MMGFVHDQHLGRPLDAKQLFVGEQFDRPLELSRERGDVLTTPLLPDFELPLTRIFQD